MSKIEFISHEAFPEDEYTKELVYLCLEGKYRIAYVRKAAKNGGLFWSGVSVGISKNGKKEFYDAFMQDSNFLEKDIKNFLDNRLWEGRSVHASSQPKSMDEVYSNSDMPF
mgnify:CR=1 FL=1